MALVAPVGWLMLRSSNTNWLRQVVVLSKSCSQRPPTMVRRSSRPSPACTAVTELLVPLKPLLKSDTDPQPATPAMSQPCWNGF